LVYFPRQQRVSFNDNHEIRRRIFLHQVKPPPNRFQPALRKTLHIDDNVNLVAIQNLFNLIDGYGFCPIGDTAEVEVVLAQKGRLCDGIGAENSFKARQSAAQPMRKSSVAGSDIEKDWGGHL